MRRKPSLSRIAAIASLVLLAPAARAGQLTVDFDFSGSSVAILGGFITVPPDGSITSASGQVVFNAPGLLTAAAGPAQLSDLAFAGTIAKNQFGLNINGAIGATQPSAAAGNLSTGLNHLIFSPFQLNFTGFANCTGGAGCGVLGLPATFTGPKVFTIASLAVGGLGINGGATLNGTFDFTLGGFTAVLNLVGTEVARTWVVPEPNTFGLLALGLAGLAVSRRQLRR